jgi:hypothetical protein
VSPDRRLGRPDRRVSRAGWVIAAATLLAVLTAPAAAYAHVPFIESSQRSDSSGPPGVPYPQAQTLPSPTVSRAIYGYLAPGARFDAYTFTVRREVTTEVSLIVPKRLGLQGFRPTLRIYAEGSGDTLNAPDPGAEPRTSFYEPFSVASFWTGPSVTATFRPDERYYVLVEPPKTGRSHGAYVLTFGGSEEFSAADWAATGAAMPVIWLGSWAGGPVRPGANACGVALVVLAVLATGLWVRRRRQRRAEAAASVETDARDSA